MQLRTILLALLLTFSNAAYAHIIIGFMGVGDAFDHSAFNDYAKHRGLTPIVLRADQIDRALQIITQSPHYELYGYSLGAQSIRRVLGRASLLPKRVVTIGAYWSTDVDFSRWGVEFYNYYDRSGRGQRSPGEFIEATHWSIQRVAVTKLLQFNH